MRDWSSDVCSSDLAQYLELAGLGVDDVIRTPFTPDIQREDTAIIMLNTGPERQVLVILGDSESALRDVVVQLSQIGRASCRERV